jgi:hypothetical protein
MKLGQKVSLENGDWLGLLVYGSTGMVDGSSGVPMFMSLAPRKPSQVDIPSFSLPSLSRFFCNNREIENMLCELWKTPQIQPYYIRVIESNLWARTQGMQSNP